MKPALLAGGAGRTERGAGRSQPPLLARGHAFQGTPARRSPPHAGAAQGAPALDLRAPTRSNRAQGGAAYQPLSLGAQAVYFPVLRGRRAGHAAGCRPSPPGNALRARGLAGRRAQALSSAACRAGGPGHGQTGNRDGTGLALPEAEAPSPLPGSGAAAWA